MPTKQELKVISLLRSNPVLRVDEISQKAGIASEDVSLIIERLQSNNVLKQHVLLVDFDKLGYKARVFFLIWTTDNRTEEFLSNHPSINTLYRLKEMPEYIAEGIFKNNKELNSFINEVNTIGTVEHAYLIQATLKKEEFLMV